MAKLFLKGGAEDSRAAVAGAGAGAASATSAKQNEILDQKWHQLLTHAHTLFRNAARTPTDPALRDVSACMDMHRGLTRFSPKMHAILRTLQSAPTHKAVVYSSFIDGVGSFGGVEPPRMSETGQRKALVSSRRFGRQTRAPSAASSGLDTGHVGLGGLGMLGYVLERNGFVRLEVGVSHPLEAVYSILAPHQRVLQAYALRDRRPLTLGALLELCEVAQRMGGSALNEKARARLRDHIDWGHFTPQSRGAGSGATQIVGRSSMGSGHLSGALTVGGLCGQFLRSPRRFPFRCIPLVAVQWRLAFSPECRANLQLDNPLKASAAASQKPTFMEYSERTIVNRHLLSSDVPVLKMILKLAKEKLLALYNLRTDTDVRIMREWWTDEAVGDVQELIGRARRRHGSSTSQVPSPVRRQSRRQHTTRSRSTSRSKSKAAGGKDTVPQSSNARAEIVQVLLASTGVTESVEFKDVRTMHILEPPEDYRKLEQMFGRVIRRGSHSGLAASERDVVIRLYVLSAPFSLERSKARATGNTAGTRHIETVDEKFWKVVIQRKYKISQEFYQVMKHMAVDCRSNLVLNSASPLDRNLTCFEYPHQATANGLTDTAGDVEEPLFALGEYEPGQGAGQVRGKVDLGWVWKGLRL